MNLREIFSHIDHTNLKQNALIDDIVKLAKESIEYQMASICIQPCYVREIKAKFPDLNIATVIGFPNGYSTRETKEFETKNALENGANEIDYVIDITKLKNKRLDSLYQDLKNIRDITSGKILKIIVETCYLTDEEKIKLCEIITELNIDYIKTSTGFGESGAKISDIELFKKHIGKNVKIKASGGIRTREKMEEFINAGCTRLGTSSVMNILE